MSSLLDVMAERLGQRLGLLVRVGRSRSSPGGTMRYALVFERTARVEVAHGVVEEVVFRHSTHPSPLTHRQAMLMVCTMLDVLRLVPDHQTSVPAGAH